MSDGDGMVTVEYSISGQAVKLGGYQDQIKIPAAELPEDPEARMALIHQYVAAEVENAVQWGWTEVGAGGEG